MLGMFQSLPIKYTQKGIEEKRENICLKCHAVRRKLLTMQPHLHPKMQLCLISIYI